MYEQISESRENGYMIEMVSLVARKKIHITINYDQKFKLIYGQS